ncbi:hypothetical protein PAMP_017180 [Pampus punctatissimus]
MPLFHLYATQPEPEQRRQIYKAHSLPPLPPTPPIRARPSPMDEERSAPAISPEPPDDGDPSPPAPQPSSHTNSTTERANSCLDPKPCPSPVYYDECEYSIRFNDNTSVKSLRVIQEQVCEHFLVAVLNLPALVSQETITEYNDGFSH